MPQIDIITIGSAVIDIFVRSSNFHLNKIDNQLMVCESYGEKIDVDSFQILTGGGATNTAVGFARLGFQTAVLAEMGKDSLAATILTELDQERIDTSLMIREAKEETGGSIILLGEDGGRTIMVHRGAASQLSVTDLPEVELKKSRWWHLSSIAGQLAVLQKLFMTARLSHIGVSWNPGNLELQLLAHGQLMPEEIEAEIMLVNHEEWHIVQNCQVQLRQKIKIIVVTNGDQGGIIIEGNRETPFGAHKVQAIDATGAGDAFATGFVAAHLYGLSLTQATQWGIAEASSVVQKIGAKPGLLSRAQLETIIPPTEIAYG